MNGAAALQQQAEVNDPIRVMIVEDSAVVRGFLRRWLDECPTVKVVRACRHGREAVAQIARSGAEVAILDIEMPEMDGLTALPLLLKASPDLRVVMSSTLTTRNADISLRALSMGAAEYVPKPETLRGTGVIDEFRSELIRKVTALGEAARRAGNLPLPSASCKAHPLREVDSHQTSSGPLSLRPFSDVNPKVLVVGSSTGGPRALQQFLKPLAGSVTVPIVIVQHMPAAFTPMLAKHLETGTGIPCAEAQDGEPLLPGRSYLAPGGRHLVLTGSATDCRAELNDDPQENYCRPAVDPMFRSAARVFGQNVLGVILTGMGIDGRQGAGEVVAAGGAVCAQDEASSVVWGMPGAAAKAGLCFAVEPIADLSKRISIMLKGATS